jgi:hypothetical protein
LLQGFANCIEQARAGRALKPFAPELERALSELQAPEWEKKIPRYMIDRVRQRSRILEPVEHIDPYRNWLAMASSSPTVAGIESRVQGFSGTPAPAEEDLCKMGYELEVLSRRGESVPSTVLHQLAEWVADWAPIGDLRNLGRKYDDDPRNAPGYTKSSADTAAMKQEYRALDQLAARVFFLGSAAALCTRPETSASLHQFIRSFCEILEAQRGEHPYGDLCWVVGNAISALRGAGSNARLEELLERVETIIRQGQEWSNVLSRGGPHLVSVLLMLQHVANGWLGLARTDRALPLLDLVAEFLSEDRNSPPVFRARLAHTHILGMKSVPSDVAMARLRELMEKLAPVNDYFTTNSHFSLSQLELADTIVMTILHHADPESPEADACMLVNP